MASNNSMTLCEHDESRYPLGSLPPGEGLRQRAAPVLSAIAKWSAGTADDNLLPALISWGKTITSGLNERGVAADYWRFYASSLLVGERIFEMEAGDNDRRPYLAKLLGHRCESLRRLWEGCTPEPSMGNLAERLLLATACEAPHGQQCFPFLREIHHSLSISHGVYGPQELTLALYSWLRSLAGRQDLP